MRDASMTVADRALTHLLGNALWGCPLPGMMGRLSQAEWQEVYGQCRLQGIHTVVFDALDHLPSGASKPALPLLARWLSEAADAERNYSHICSVASEQAGWWKDAGIAAVLIKGETIARMYPVPEHRVCGDIDWYFPDQEAWNAASEYVVKRFGVVPEPDSDGDVHYEYDGVVVEHHRRWSHLSARRVASRFDGRIPDMADTLFMLNAHILRHAMVGGVGLRQLCDLAVAYRYLDGRYDRGLLRSLLELSGLDRWTPVLHSALLELTGLDPAFLPVPAGGREKDIRRFESMVLSDGNFGSGRAGRGGCLTGRAGLFIRLVPREFMGRYMGLLCGKTRKTVRKFLNSQV